MLYVKQAPTMVIVISGKSSSGNEAMRVLLYIWYWKKLIRYRNVDSSAAHQARILFSSFTVIYKNM